jgi:hypothetical protein
MVEEETEPAAAVASSSHRRKGKGKGKGKAKAKAKGRAKGAALASAGEEEQEDTKFCNDCEKDLPLSEFNKAQAKCADCNNRRRKFGRVCAHQDAEEKMKTLEAILAQTSDTVICQLRIVGLLLGSPPVGATSGATSPILSAESVNPIGRITTDSTIEVASRICRRQLHS